MHTGKLNLADFILNKNSSALLETGSCFSARITVCSATLGLCLSLILMPQQILAEEGQALPDNWEKISLKKINLRVIDGIPLMRILIETDASPILKNEFGCFTLILRN